MAKDVKFAGQSAGIPITPAQTLSEALASVYPIHIDKDENGSKMLGAEGVVNYDPLTGRFQVPVYIVSQGGVVETRPIDPTSMKVANYSGAGDNAIWTPAAGKKFRLMGFSFAMNSSVTTAGGSLVTLKDGATVIFDVFNVGTTMSNMFGVVNLPNNGYLSAAANNVLNVNLSNAFTGGGIYLTVWGIEE